MTFFSTQFLWPTAHALPYLISFIGWAEAVEVITVDQHIPKHNLNQIHLGENDSEESSN